MVAHLSSLDHDNLQNNLCLNLHYPSYHSGLNMWDTEYIRVDKEL